MTDIERGGAAAIERGGTAAASDASGGTSAASGTQAAMPNITSLEDITSMEDITSLEDLQLDDLKSESAITSPDRVEKFRRTVKAMSTQVTPQTSPLGKHAYYVHHRPIRIGGLWCPNEDHVILIYTHSPCGQSM